MAYLGNAPARSFISFERQVFTIVNSQTVYTLSHSVTNENDIRLVVNNVVQEPGSGKAYTASGTTLTLSEALVNGTDEMYCVFLGRATATNAPGAGSVGTSQLVDLNVTTGKIAADAITNAKIADDAISDEQLDPTVITGQTAETSIATDDLILLSDTSASGALRKMTRANFVSGVGGNMSPSFAASALGNNALGGANQWTKVQFSTEIMDNGGVYDPSTYRFTPNEAGKYFISSFINWYASNGNVSNVGPAVYKNGSEYQVFRDTGYTSNQSAYYVGSSTYNGILDLNGTGDYIEIYWISNYSSNAPALNAHLGGSTFSGFKIIE